MVELWVEFQSMGTGSWSQRAVGCAGVCVCAPQMMMDVWGPQRGDVGPLRGLLPWLVSGARACGPFPPSHCEAVMAINAINLCSRAGVNVHSS